MEVTRQAGDAATELAERVVAAARAALGVDLEPGDALVRPGNPQHGADWQSNLAMPLAKRLKRNPREVAEEIRSHLDSAGLVASVDIAGPGFLNFRLEDAWLANALVQMGRDPRLGAGAKHTAQRVVIDYSAPNIAKEMHVGHLRSTIIGDALARTLRFVGDEVIPQNHVGDWGTQFGMLIEELDDRGWNAGAGDSIADLDEFYRQARAHFDADEAFADRARRRVVKLQSGDPETMATWRALVAESQHHFEHVYALLDVGLSAEDMAGESIYNDQLAPTVEALEEAGQLELDDGALCAFPAGFQNRDGDRMPLMLRKSDGGYTYDTTDVAAIRHRIFDLRAQRILYVVGVPQSQHFQMVFAVAEAAGWLSHGVEVEHVAFGSVLGEDRKILRTRAGVSVKLIELLDEAIKRAQAILEERSGTSDPELARQVGIGAVKYADLSTDRRKDYVFSFERMLSLEGNTSVYLQYAHARTCAVLRRAGERAPEGAEPASIGGEAERELALKLIAFGGAVDAVVETLEPHRLCTYLFELAAVFSNFYEKCPILKAEGAERERRLLLTTLTERVLGAGLPLLGIQAPDRL